MVAFRDACRDAFFPRNALLPNLLDADKDWIAKKAATNRQVTFAEASELHSMSMKICDSVVSAILKFELRKSPIVNELLCMDSLNSRAGVSDQMARERTPLVW